MNYWKQSPKNIYVAAHRGLSSDYPENTMAAFRAAIAVGVDQIETDIRVSKDGELVLIHDATVDRTTNGHGRVDEMTFAELRTLRLSGTEHGIPTLREVLAAVDGKVPLLVELKGENISTSVCGPVDEILREYRGAYLIESFNPLLLRWYRKNHPEVLRGQLTTDLAGSMGKTLRNHLLDSLLLNVVTRPDFLAYDIRCPKRLPVRLCTGFFHAARFVWTIRDKEEYRRGEALHAFAIFENFCPPVTLTEK